MGSFHTLGSYVKAGLELSRGYNLAMSIAGPQTEFLAAIETLVFLAIVLVLLRSNDHRTAWFLVLILAVPILVSIKHGFVRLDAHIIHFFCFVAIVAIQQP